MTTRRFRPGVIELEGRAVPAATFVVTTTADAGSGTLRQAILDANASPGADTIAFAIGSGVQTISPLGPLPTVTDSLTIDGTTQPGYAGTPVVVLTGGNAGPGASGLAITAANSTIRGLVVNGFGGNGIHITGAGATGNVIADNYIGTDVTGTVAVGNGGSIFVDAGIKISDGASGNTIGGTTAGAGNVISGNNAAGVFVTGATTSNTVIRGNFIGTNATGTSAIGNAYVGVWVNSAPNVTLGGGMSGARNVISGNNNLGVYGDGEGFRIQGNYFDLDSAGTTALLNAGGSVSVGGPNMILGVDGDGMNDAGEGNAIAHGVTLGPLNLSGTVFAGNVIGLNAAGTAKVGSGRVNVYYTASGAIRFGTNADGVSDTLERNLFATGLTLAGGSNHVVAGNYFGTDVTGLVGLGSGHISIETNGVRFGTNADGVRDDIERNVVADGDIGLLIYSSNNIVAGNYIGLGADGSTTLPNRIGPLLYGGVSILGGPLGGGNVTGNVIGGTTAAARNVIAGHAKAAGVTIRYDGASGNLVQGNFIGTDVTGTSALPNAVGVLIEQGASNNIIGGTTVGAGNVIKWNSGAGIAIGADAANIRNRVRGNAISGNGGLGIDLGNDGVTENDTGDADTGPNELQNFPAVAEATGGPTTSVNGTLHSTPNATFTLDFYANAGGDPEGGRYLGSITATTDGSGNAAFNATLAAASAAGEVVTATATDPAGNTSEFSVATPPVAVPQVSLSGRVFDDRNNDGLFNGSDSGLAGVAVAMLDANNVTVATTTAGGDGKYTFVGTFPTGTYRVVAARPAGLLDGKETAGTLGGTVDNTRDRDEIGGIVLHGGDVGTGYDFADIRPSRVQSLVWVDFNNDGEVDFGEKAVAGAAVALTGTDDRGNLVSRTVTTDGQGLAELFDLRPGTYALTEAQPAGYADGKDTRGTVNGVAVGDAGVNDRFGGLLLPTPGSDAVNYNFGERPAAGGGVGPGQTASIGLWQNKNGQHLIKAVNSGPAATQLGNWLAATFPNMYGAAAGLNNLTGKTNAQVAAFYLTLFQQNGQTSPGGPPKLDAQVLATAFAVYVTNQTLAGTAAAGYGFQVTEYGVGAATFNVGSNGAAFGVANHASVSVLNLLLAVNARTANGILYDLDGSGTIGTAERSLRTQANDVFASINELGNI